MFICENIKKTIKSRFMNTIELRQKARVGNDLLQKPGLPPVFLLRKVDDGIPPLVKV